MHTAQTVGARLRQARQTAGLSRRAVENAAGVSARVLEKLEADQQELSLSRATALSRLYGLPLTELTDAPQSPSTGNTAEPTPLTAESVGRLLAGLSQAARPHPAPAARTPRRSRPVEVAPEPEEEDEDLTPRSLDLVVEQFERLDQAVTAGQQPRWLPGVVQRLVRVPLGTDQLEELARDRGVTLPRGLDPTAGMRLLVADAFFDGITRFGETELDRLADRIAAASGVRRGSGWAHKEVLTARRSGVRFLVRGNAREHRDRLLRQVSDLVVRLSLERRVPLR